ncbi:cilia- and flagella-associated protein 251-like [Pogonomyrmex barbatus]|uniref:Cilia- and flagella-associated protein 251-like n=1 Tax=Pogonomyrmex barbatus TaxID=144034 RepID=A0A8N1S2Q1_9HYME|nr:cilia- and flagella-associated protein 251-like [Pogonomyrmex barbatus]
MKKEEEQEDEKEGEEKEEHVEERETEIEKEIREISPGNFLSPILHVRGRRRRQKASYLSEKYHTRTSKSRSVEEAEYLDSSGEFRRGRGARNN